MLVGEIGIPRREFLYEVSYWEVVRIVKGYRRRDMLKHQLLAEIVYTTTYTMRDPKGKTVTDMFPSLFNSEEENEDSVTISQEDVDDLQQLMATINAEAEG